MATWFVCQNAMSTHDTARTESSEDDDTHLLAGAVRGVLEATEQECLTADAIAECVGASPSQVRERLEELAIEGSVARVPMGENATGWMSATSIVESRESTNSHVVTDRATGLVTRADTRGRAYRRLGDRIEQFEDGDHIGAQILGIAERVMSPTYVDSFDHLVESYVESGDKHLYVYVENDGVIEVETVTELSRSQRILGFALTGVYDREEFAEASMIPLDRLFDETRIEPHHFPLGVFKVTAVHPDHQQQGIGEALGSHGMAYLAQHPPVVTMLWDRSDNRGNVKLVEEYPGTEHLATFESATPLKYRCPVCSFGTECECGTILYGWGFDVIA